MVDGISKGYLGFLRELAQCASGEQTIFVFEHPALISPNIQHKLRAELAGVDPAEGVLLAKVLTTLEKFMELAQKRPYPIGLGPLERIWKRQADGEILPHKAEEFAADPAVSCLLSPIYVVNLSRSALCMAMQTHSWAEALGRQRLLLAAVEAASDHPDFESMLQEAGGDFIEIAHIVLAQIADGRIYRKALSLGTQLVELARRKKDKKRLGALLFRLGILHLDPYMVGRSIIPAKYKAQIHRWQESTVEQLGSKFLRVPERQRRMPPPGTAFRLAEKYLRESVKLSRGDNQYRSLKALSQALTWQHEVLKKVVDQRELLSICRRALRSLDLECYPLQRAAVMSIISHHGGRIDLGEIDRFFQRSIDEYLRRLGPVTTVHFVKEIAAILSRHDLGRALDVLRNASTLFRKYGSEDDRTFFWETQLGFFAKTFGPNLKARRRKRSLNATAEYLRDRAAAEKWDVRKHAAGLVGLALHSEKVSEEEAALKILDDAEKLVPMLMPHYADAFAFLRAVLQQGVAVNHINSGSWHAAITPYNNSLSGYLDLGLKDMVMDRLGRIVDSVEREKEADVGVRVITGLSPLALRLQQKLGEPGSYMIQRLCKRTIATLSGDASSAETAFALLQVAKGLRFSTTLYAGLRANWRKNEEDTRMLAEIYESEALARKEDPGEVGAERISTSEEEILLTSYVGASEQRQGDTAKERLINRRQAYDLQLNKSLLSSMARDEALYLKLSEVQAALDSRTVLAYFYLGASRTEQVTIYLFLVTREAIRVHSEKYGSKDGILEEESSGRTFRMHQLAPLVQAVRKDIFEDPWGPGERTEKAAARLAADRELFFGAATDWLEEFRAAGKDHLCIVPHGPLHFYPFHLLGNEGVPLAAQWIVTYLPSLHLLISRRGQSGLSRHRERPLTSLGLDFEDLNPFKLPLMTDSLVEAKEVARIFKTTPLLNKQATREAFFDALSQSRFVHLSTHGSHDADAPAFQTVYLSPNNGSDGRLFAHELLSHDLHGLQLLTLSACETALGRFDVDDNLRGMPASFFQAGVSTVIGTLWEAEIGAAREFFTVLYRELKAGAGRLEAFHTAQRETRASLPQYRDWGAFHFMGVWDPPNL